MQDTISKLYGFIARLVVSLEDELDEIQNNRSKSALKLKKSITDSLNKLVSLIIMLGKLRDSELGDAEEGFPEEDAEIINEFLKKYNDKSKNAKK